MQFDFIIAYNASCILLGQLVALGGVGVHETALHREDRLGQGWQDFSVGVSKTFFFFILVACQI